MPWWAALIIAVGATATGFAIDAGSGHKELTHVFAGFYIAGCVAAVLAVRQDGVFTAVIQPPLILFCAVPGGYWLFHGRKVGHLKDLLINCGYPLIERFPLMLFTAGGVLVIGLARWYLGMSHRAVASSAEGAGDTPKAAHLMSFVGVVVAKLQSVVQGNPDERDPEKATEKATAAKARRARSARRPADARRTARSDRAGTRTARTRARPPLEEPQERPRRADRRSQAGSRDLDPAEQPRRQRRPRPQGEPERGQSRRESHTRRSPYERPVPRGSRFDGFEPYQDPYQPPGDRYSPYQPRDGYEARSRRSTARGTNGAEPTHHPISRVRYRGEGPAGEQRADRPSRSRASGRSTGRPPAEFWEYDR